MGIYDRDYVREQDSRRRKPGLALGRTGWSVTTWLIVICVGVHVLDYYLPIRWVLANHIVLRQDLSFDEDYSAKVRGYDRSRLEFGPNAMQVSTRLPSGQAVLWVVPVVEKSTRVLQGYMPVYPMRRIASYLHFSTSTFLLPEWGTTSFPRMEFWRLIGFQFLHANSMHLLFNMIGLFFFGPLVEQYLGSKRYLAFYLLCGIAGALLYLILNLGGYILSLRFGAQIYVPGLLFADPSTPLVGASAGIFGVIVAGAFIAPRERVYLLGLLPIRLQTLAYFLVGLAVFTILVGGRNAGGEAGHLGGAIAGFYFIRRPHHLHNFFDILGRVDPTSHHYRKHREAGLRPSRAAELAELDRILEKIHIEGMDSLTDSERRILRDSSERGR